MHTVESVIWDYDQIWSFNPAPRLGNRREGMQFYFDVCDGERRYFARPYVSLNGGESWFENGMPFVVDGNKEVFRV